MSDSETPASTEAPAPTSSSGHTQEQIDAVKAQLAQAKAFLKDFEALQARHGPAPTHAHACGDPGCGHDHGPPPAPFKRRGAKVGRNDPCPCGSGKKFKRCCG